ncbi:HECT-domain (ubiquitin-transferase) domain-containing protein [Toxoplasma gondii GT1]|uniref:HECT-type E3 ubiquitin transferase n=2 Tax=Toxoplasma gondii TaxID=5811 RepID=S7UNJ5_TOXGG|nr:HECT-domain (ubiquitin-transferase) domain-containing protein [Toxoplasma gondii GT1]KAF4645470.1 HECT-domain (ubiquitin-transferase) domain-containing protein [Toxoplasma gondii]
MFSDFTHSSNRRIDLSGASRPAFVRGRLAAGVAGSSGAACRSSLLEFQRRERQLREQHRRSVDAALKVQRCWRSSFVRRQTKGDHRRAFDAAVAALLAGAEDGTGSGASETGRRTRFEGKSCETHTHGQPAARRALCIQRALPRLIRQLAFFFDPDEDGQRRRSPSRSQGGRQTRELEVPTAGDASTLATVGEAGNKLDCVARTLAQERSSGGMQVTFYAGGTTVFTDDVARLALLCDWVLNLGEDHAIHGRLCGTCNASRRQAPFDVEMEDATRASINTCLFPLAAEELRSTEQTPAPPLTSQAPDSSSHAPSTRASARDRLPHEPRFLQLLATTELRLLLQCAALRYRAVLFSNEAPASLLPPRFLVPQASEGSRDRSPAACDSSVTAAPATVSLFGGRGSLGTREMRTEWGLKQDKMTRLLGLENGNSRDEPPRRVAGLSAFSWVHLRPACGWRGSVLASSLRTFARTDDNAATNGKKEPATSGGVGAGDSGGLGERPSALLGGQENAEEGVDVASNLLAGRRSVGASDPPFFLLPAGPETPEKGVQELWHWIRSVRDILLAVASASASGDSLESDRVAEILPNSSDAGGLSRLLRSWRVVGGGPLAAMLGDALADAMTTPAEVEEGAICGEGRTISDRRERDLAAAVETWLCVCRAADDVSGELEFLVHLFGAPCLVPVFDATGPPPSPLSSSSPSVLTASRLPLLADDESEKWRRRTRFLTLVLGRMLSSVAGCDALQSLLQMLQLPQLSPKHRGALPKSTVVTLPSRGALGGEPPAAKQLEGQTASRRLREAEQQIRDLVTKDVSRRVRTEAEAANGREGELVQVRKSPLVLCLAGNALGLLHNQIEVGDPDSRDWAKNRGDKEGGGQEDKAAQRTLLCVLCWAATFAHDELLRQSVLSSEEQQTGETQGEKEPGIDAALRRQLRLLMTPAVLRALFDCADEDPPNRFPPLLRIFFPPSLCACPSADTRVDTAPQGEAGESLSAREEPSEVESSEDETEDTMTAFNASAADPSADGGSEPAIGVDRLILNALAMNTSLSTHLLPVIRHVFDAECGGDVDQFLRRLGPAPFFDAPLGQVLRAACTLLQYQLELMYDSELVETSRSAPLPGFRPPASSSSSSSSSSSLAPLSSSPLLTASDFQWLSLTLNKVAWKLLQACYTPSVSSPPSISALRAPISSLSNAWAAVVSPGVSGLGAERLGRHSRSGEERRRGLSRSHSSSLRGVLTTLVRQLFDRNSRLHFLPETSWILPDTMYLLKSKALLHQQERLAQLDASFAPPPRAEEAATEGLERVANTGVKHAEKILAALLTELPHTMAFEDRVLVFYDKINADRLRFRDAFHQLPFDRSLHEIRRGYIVEDGLFALGYADEHDLKGFFRIQFITGEGVPEEGIDGGGLFKEFLVLLSRKVFDPDYGLFKASSDNSLYPNPSVHLAHTHPTALYNALGKVVGKAIYEKILIEPQLNRVFLNLLLGRPNQVDDVQALDPVVHKNLLFLKHYTDNVQNLALSFSATLGDFGSNEEEDLIPNGRTIPVTNDSKLRYIQAVAHFKCTKQIAKQTQAFLNGLSQVIPLKWLKMFSPAELQLLISGSPLGFDVADLRAHANFTGGFEASSPTICWLWDTLEEMSSEERSKFLMFVTSCSRPPLLGFRNLHPSFTVHRVPERHRLPTSSTCVNLLKLPPYESKEVLRERLMEAIEGAEGFGLS